MLPHKACLISTAVIGALLLQPTTTSSTTLAPSGPISGEPVAAQAPAVQADYGQMPLYFVENQGQMDERVAYYIPGSDKTIYFTPEGVTFALTAPGPVTDTARAERPAAKPAPRDERREQGIPEPAALQRWTVKLEFIGADPNVRPVAEEQAEAVFSYFTGGPDEWHAGLRSYRKLVYPELWPGIDLVYYGTVNQMKYEFVVKPGADPDQIRLAYRGATGVQINAIGQMEVRTPIGGFRDDTPVAYQDLEGQRVSVSMAYALDPQDSLATQQPQRNSASSPTYGFTIGHYDPTRLLVLDPAVLVYAGYIGGSDVDRGLDVAVDGAGNAYVTGYTGSDQTAFPVKEGPDLTFNDGLDAFVAKVNALGTELVYVGYIGGAGAFPWDWEEGGGIAVDGAGNAYVAGFTGSSNALFPVLVGPDLTSNGGYDAFVAKVNATGTALIYAGYIGGASYDSGKGIAVDGAGNAYVTGTTQSDEATFPVAVGPDVTFNGGSDTFVAKVNAGGTALLYAGYIGGAGYELANTSDSYGGADIAVDEAGNAYVTGETTSDQTTFPVAVGPDLTYNGGNDAFVAKVNAGGTALLYAGYIGGASLDHGNGIAVDGAGNAYVTGYTGSEQMTFPVAVGPDLTFNGGTHDAFVAKVNAGGTTLLYAGYIGGAGDDWGNGIAVDEAGNAYVAGATVSDETTFPVLNGPDLTLNFPPNSTGWDAFVAKLNAGGAALLYAGYIGGMGVDEAYAIAVDGVGNAYVTGYTESEQMTFPVAVGPDLTYNGGSDAFVAKVSTTDTQSPPTVIVIPGIMGSRLANDPSCAWRASGEVWPNLKNPFKPYNYSLSSLILDDSGEGAADDCDHISPTTVFADTSDLSLGTIVPVRDYYGDIATRLKEDYPVETFAYDWRKDLRSIANDLDSFIADKQLGQVVLVGHSMGGLVARTYISSSSRAARVLGVITVGTPYWGAPKLAINMRNGANPFPFPLDRVPDPEIIKAIIRNSPGAMELLPSQTFIDQLTVNGRAGYFITPDGTLLNSAVLTANFLSSDGGQNRALLDAAAAFHVQLDTMPQNLPDGLTYYALRAMNRLTPIQIRERRRCLLNDYKCVTVESWIYGDGTVPYISAGLGGHGQLAGGARVCTYSVSDPLAEHGELLSDDTVGSDIGAIIRSMRDGTTPFTHCLQGGTIPGWDQAPAPSEATEDSLAAGVRAYEVRVWGQADALVTLTSGESIGVTPGGWITNTIAGATVSLLSDGSEFTLPAGHMYALHLNATNATERVFLEVSELQGPSGTEALVRVAQATFLDIPLATGYSGETQLDFTGTLPALSLTVLDGSGQLVSTMNPGSVIGGADLSDMVPPTTAIQILGTRDAQGVLRGSVVVSLAATDAGSGVARTYFSVDEGKTWSVYTGSLTVQAETVPAITAYSLDHANNVEYPSVSMRLQPYRLHIPLLRH